MVDRAPSTRELNFMETAMAGPGIVASIAGEDWINTAWASATRGTNINASATEIISEARDTIRATELRGKFFIPCWTHLRTKGFKKLNLDLETATYHALVHRLIA